MKNKKQNLKGFTITELLVVLAIIGILVMLVLPNQTGIISKAKAVEAQNELKQAYSLQKYYHNLYSKYSNNLDEIDYIQEKLTTEGGGKNYKLEIVEASPGSFRIQAKAVVDFNNNGVFNVWEINQDQKLKEIVKD